MPRGHIIPVEDADYNHLPAKLEQEWREPDTSATEPVIIETSDLLRPQQTPTHLYVIWERMA